EAKATGENIHGGAHGGGLATTPWKNQRGRQDLQKKFKKFLVQSNQNNHRNEVLRVKSVYSKDYQPFGSRGIEKQQRFWILARWLRFPASFGGGRSSGAADGSFSGHMA
ncbi:hypothetical protein RYX36_011998, partial [Vicia faba]